MSDQYQFTHQIQDISTDRGFQFEVTCNRCGSGVRTQFKQYVAGGIADALHTANSLFGGILGRASELGDHVRGAGWQKARDNAMQGAAQELLESFIQCPRCSTWVCRKSCWNTKKGLCKGCAPDLGVEMAAAQASKSVEEVWAHAAMAEEDKKLDTAQWREGIRASCPQCEAPLATNAKFCPECGAKLKGGDQCAKCDAKLTPGAKFCPECGEKV